MKLNYRRTFFIGLAFLSISAFWQMYDNIIPLMLQGTFRLGETVTGAIMAADNVLALFLLPLFGSLSDRLDTRAGKRVTDTYYNILCGIVQNEVGDNKGTTNMVEEMIKAQTVASSCILTRGLLQAERTGTV